MKHNMFIPPLQGIELCWTYHFGVRLSAVWLFFLALHPAHRPILPKLHGGNGDKRSVR